MRFNEMRPGDYVIRTRELPWARVLSGNICYVTGVYDDKLNIQLTEECLPNGKVFAVPTQADDGDWYKVNHLVLEANSCIYPETSECCSFNSHVAASYRNFLGFGEEHHVPIRDAVGRICLLGEQKGDNTVFSKLGYFIAGFDNNGYVIAYRGFCTYVEAGAGASKIELCILNLNNTARGFYDAEAIVEACCKAYEDDMRTADKFTAIINEQSVSKSADTSIGSSIFNTVAYMDLGAGA